MTDARGEAWLEVRRLDDGAVVWKKPAPPGLSDLVTTAKIVVAAGKAYELDTGTEVPTPSEIELFGHGHAVTDLVDDATIAAFAKQFDVPPQEVLENRNLLVVEDENGIHVHRADRQRTFTVPSLADETNATIQFAPRDDRLAVQRMSDFDKVAWFRLHLYDTDTGEVLFSTTESRPLTARFDPNGELVAVESPASASTVLVRLDDGKVVRGLHGGDGMWSPNGSYYRYQRDDTCVVRHVASGELRFRSPAPPRTIALRFGRDPGVVFDVTTAGIFELDARTASRRAVIEANILAFELDALQKRGAFMTETGALSIVDFDSRRVISTLNARVDDAFAFSPEGDRIAIASSDELRIESIDGKRPARVVGRPGGAPVLSLEWSSTGKHLGVRSWLQGVTTFDLAHDNERTVIEPDGEIEDDFEPAMAFRPGTSELAYRTTTRGHSTVTVVDLDDPTKRASAPVDLGVGVAFTTDGRALLVAPNDGSRNLGLGPLVGIDVVPVARAELEIARRLPAPEVVAMVDHTEPHFRGIDTLAVSADGAWLANAVPDGVRLAHRPSGDALLFVEASTGASRGVVVLTPDRRTFDAPETLWPALLLVDPPPTGGPAAELRTYRRAGLLEAFFARHAPTK